METEPQTAKSIGQAKRLSLAKTEYLSGCTLQTAAERAGVSLTAVAAESSRKNWPLLRREARGQTLMQGIDWRAEAEEYRARSLRDGTVLLESVMALPDVRDKVELWRIVNRELRAILGLETGGGGAQVQIAMFAAPGAPR